MDLLPLALTGRQYVAAAYLVFLALVLLWETAPRFGLVDRTFLPPFSEVARAWW